MYYIYTFIYNIMSSKIAADFDLVSTVHISHYSFVVSRVVLHSSAQIVLTLFSDEDSSFAKSIVFKIEGEEYQKWGSDDSYISELVAAKVASLKPLEPLPEPKAEELSAEEPKAEELSAEEPKAEELKAEEPKAEELKVEELKE
ncbi:putative anthocyanidin reductase ((2S)-flavan-3-ol-forming)-like protein [Dishui Lake virophage 6]|nr:putative anthocyanidin reductase ((2S)-flavan-3-ol-forming)-like protein [Dishui Lake virophage 6]